MENTDKRITRMIRELCSKEGSQTRFASRIGASPQKVNNWVNGRNEPNKEMLYAISEAYEIPMSDLIDSDTRVDVDHVLPLSQHQMDTQEINCCLIQMSENQRKAVLAVARAMVE